MADLPGLIEGASEGSGLGHDFLKHIERTKIIAHIIDIMPVDGSDPFENYKTIRSELDKYSVALAQKPEVIIANKTDLDSDGKALKESRRKTPAANPFNLRRNRLRHKRISRTTLAKSKRPKNHNLG